MASPLDQYSPCPGGTGKKIRFCCPQLLPELQRIQRMMEGQQWHACLEHIERVQASFPDRACLFALKGATLFELNRREELKANAEAFAARHPENPLAQAERACGLAAEDGGGPRAAIAPMLAALALCRDDGTHQKLLRHLLFIASQLVRFGLTQAACALLKAWGGEEMLLNFDVALGDPLWHRDPRPLAPCPADFPWKAEYDQALQHAQTLRWFEAERGFAELAGRANGTLAVWQNLMVVRGWLGDVAGSAEAARRCASLAASEDDAAELEAYAAYSSGEMLGDHIRIPKVEYPVTDPKALRSALEREAGITPLEMLSSAEIKRELERDTSAKRYRLLGPPVPPAGIPDWACLLILTQGKGEDSPQLTIIAFTPESLADAQGRVESLAPGALGPRRLREEAEQSATEGYLRQEWLLGMQAPPSWEAALAARQQTFLCQRWPKTPLGLLGGKTFEEGLADGALRRRTLAALLLLEHYLDRAGVAAGGEALRSLLGLPPREPIDPGVIPPDSVPLARLHLVDTEKLKGPPLEAAFKRALCFSASAAIAHLSPALAHDDSVPWSALRVEAARVALHLDPNYARVVALCQKWRQAARQVPGACAKFDLEEVRARILRGNLREAANLLKHLSTEHCEEPGVYHAVELFATLIEALIERGMRATQQQRQPSIIAPDGGEPGKLWTPDSAHQPGPKPTLWTPGNS